MTRYDFLMRGKWLLIFGTAVLLAIAAAAGRLLWRERVERAAAPPRAATPALPSEVSLPGKIQAQSVLSVPAPIEGTVEAFLAEVGDEVYQGQALARIANTGLEPAQQAANAEVERARARVTSLEGALIAARLEASRARADASRARSEFDRAERTYLRQRMLYREGATPRLSFEKSQQEYDNSQSEFRNLDELAQHSEDRVAALMKDLEFARTVLNEKTQELENAQARLSAAEVHAPADGILVGRNRQVGEEVNPHVKDFLQIAINLGALEVVLEPEPPVLKRIRPGQDALVLVVEFSNEPLPGRVRQITENRVLVEFTSPNAAVRPGQNAQVLVKLT